MAYAFHPTATLPGTEPRVSTRSNAGPTMVPEYDAMGNPTGSMVEVAPDQSSMGYWEQVSHLAKMADDGMRMAANGMTFGGADRLAGLGDYVTGQAQSYDAGAKAEFARTQKVREEHPVAVVNTINDAVSAAWNELTKKAAGDPQPFGDTPKYGGTAMNIGAGLDEGLYAVAGFPVDGTRFAMNAGIAGINAATGAELPSFPNDGLMGSRWIGQQMGKLHPAMNPENTVAATPGERIARSTGNGIGGSIFPEAAFSKLSSSLNLKESAIPLVRALAERALGPGNLVDGLLIGGSAGMASGVAQEVVPDRWKPLAGLAGALLGGGGVAALTAPVQIGQTLTHGGPEAVEKAMRNYAEAMAAGKILPDRLPDAKREAVEQAMRDYTEAIVAGKILPDRSPDVNLPFPPRQSKRQTIDVPRDPPEDVRKYYTPEMLANTEDPYVDSNGNFLRTFEGVPITAENVVGFINMNKPQQPLPGDIMWRLAGKFAKKPPREVYNDEMGDDLGLTHLSKGGGKVERIELNKTLHPGDMYPTLSHEFGHAIDEISKLSEKKLEHELSRNYHRSNTGEEYDESLGGEGLVTPESRGYHPDEARYERWAEAHKLYFMDPNTMKIRMPLTAKVIRTLNKDPEFNTILQWNSVLPPILLGGAGYEAIAHGDKIND